LIKSKRNIIKKNPKTKKKFIEKKEKSKELVKEE
jgi:hypothetical protein